MSFHTLGLSEPILKAIKEQGYTNPTPIQKEAIPVILEKKDVLAGAQTGTGKTAGFTLPLLELLSRTKPTKAKQHVKVLILTPTRELASQVHDSVELYGRHLPFKSTVIFGGVKINPQIVKLKKGVDIVVATPGRLLDHLSQRTIDLRHVKYLVLDEADRMLDMGFINDIKKILAILPNEKQTLLFSATYPDEILELSSSIQKEALCIKTTEIEVQNKIVEQFYETEEKLVTLITIFAKNNPKNAIVFCNTKLECDEVAASLQSLHVDALALHGDLEQYDRNDVLVQFSNGSCRVLVATDVAARGLDIKELAMVINYDLPHSQETYTHRIGRTARAGEEGIACTLYSSFELEKIQEYKNERREFLHVESAALVKSFQMPSEFITLVIEGGKKEKLRKGDILGALTSNREISGDSIGKIELYERQSYVAIKAKEIQKAHKKLSTERIKAKKFSVWILE